MGDDRPSAEPAPFDASEVRYRALAEHALDLISEVAPDGRILYASPNHAGLLGIDPAKRIGRSGLEGMHPDDVPMILRELSRATVSGQTATVQYRYSAAGGGWRWLESVGRSYEAEDGSVRVVIVSRDITERKHAEQELLETRALLEAVLEGSLDGVTVYDAIRSESGEIVDFRVLRVNRAGERIIGRSREHLVGRRLRELFPGVVTDGFFERWCGVVETGEPLEYEHWYEHEGLAVWFHAKVVRVGDGIALTYSDVTERRRLEEQLRQSQKMEAVGRLAGGVAHDFNNLLTAIQGYGTHLLERLERDDPRREEVSEILRAGERATDLTRQLLAFSRRQDLAPEIVDLNALVSEVERLLRRLIGEHIELATDLGEERLCVRADPGQLQQVLVNLAVNARDAMPEGGRLTIETRPLRIDASSGTATPVGQGDWVRLSVTDTGFGMDEATLARVFEPFFTTKEPGRGTGLGLASVYGTVQQSGGQVEVSSRPGIGSTFTIYLPRTSGDAAVPAPRVGAAAEAGAAWRGRETVLLVEDEEQIRRLARRTLELAGYRVLDASDGAAACDLALRRGLSGASPIDLLVTDVVMPRVGGLELADRLRRLNPRLPVLFMSGYGEGVHGERGAKQPLSALLEKPFLPKQLLAEVRALLDRED
ncbi:MAG TPA: PAS domain S-box protein [Myxococcota bacterium]|nr:PAS domain S-box protein [Myxococcota bacterium]